MRRRNLVTDLLRDVEVERIEVFRLCPGCAPEHDRELIGTVTSKDDIDRILAELKRIKEKRKAGGERAARPTKDGGVVYEHKLCLSDEGVLSYILAEALTEIQKGE